jgi:hypothetical protein
MNILISGAGWRGIPASCNAPGNRKVPLWGVPSHDLGLGGLSLVATNHAVAARGERGGSDGEGPHLVESCEGLIVTSVDFPQRVPQPLQQ